MNKNNNTTFNGSYTTDVVYDSITYCPFCEKKLPEPTGVIHYCPFCGKAIPRTTTSEMIVYHWNTPDGTVTYPNYNTK